MGFPDGYSDTIKKEAKDISAHQDRRRVLLLSSASVRVMTFIVSYALAPCLAAPPDPFEQVCADLPEGVGEAWAVARQSCPHNMDRNSRGLQTSRLPPDYAEMSSHSTSFLAEGFQSRKSVGPRLPTRALPTGLTQKEHFEAALDAVSPLDKEPPVADDYEFAVRTIVREGKQINEWREKQMGVFMNLRNRCSAHAVRLEAQRSENSSLCAGNIDLAGIELGAISIGWPDVQLGDLFRAGARPVGKQDHIGIYRHKDTKASKSEADIVAEHTRERPFFEKRPPPSGEVAQAVWDQTLDEQAMGFLTEFKSVRDLDALFGKDQWVSLPRFAVW